MTGAPQAADATCVLVFNSGSSSLKFGLFEVNASGTTERVSGELEGVGSASGSFRSSRSDGIGEPPVLSPAATLCDAVARIAAVIEHAGLPPPDAVGHRVVHGGPQLRKHCVIDREVQRHMEIAAAFAPLHTPAILEVVKAARDRFSLCPQVACFDTAFHAGMPDVSRLLPIPRHFESEGLWRYGFHGLSCESILRRLAPDIPDRLIIAHLGNGASVTAVRDGRSIDTSMGLTPSGGIVMGTRSGDLDPGVLIHLVREQSLGHAELEDLIDHRSGLAGISGIGSDMRVLHAASAANGDARLAIEMFCYSASKQIAAMMAALGGCDAIVFTGGIGENDAVVRRKILERLAWAGVALEGPVDGGVKTPGRVPMRTIRSEEDEQIARHTWALTRRRT
jgi:acetate kinase